MKIFNRNAKRKYHILETMEAGIVLSGADVKSIRAGRADLSESFARIQNGEVVLKNLYIPPYQGGVPQDYDPRADHKLLLHRKQIRLLSLKVSKSAHTLVPLSLYTARNMIKVELALAASKKKYDHRKAIKERDEQRRIEQELRGFKDNDLRK